MTEKEIIQKIYEAIKLVDCMQYNPLVDFNYLRAKGAYNIIKNQVEHIEAENAELRARLEAAESMPKRIKGGDMKYTEILKLKRMLEEANIPFEFTDDFWGVNKLEKNGKITPYLGELYRNKYPAYQIRLGDLADAIQYDGSYGNRQDLLEIMGGLTEKEKEEDSVLGYLTAEEVFKRFKYCYEHKTSTYKKENNDD